VEGRCLADITYCPGSPAETGNESIYGWDCTNAREGKICRARCKPGPKGDLVGTLISVCQAGVYTSASGSCHIATSACTSGPTADPGPYGQEWPSWCTNTPDGSPCTSSCISSTYEGDLVTLCQGANNWSAVLGSCKKVDWKCYTLPTTSQLADSPWPISALPVNLGATIRASCASNNGFRYEGTMTATCLGNNRWSAVKGGCYKPPTSCYGPPAFSPGPNTSGWRLKPHTQTYHGIMAGAKCLLQQSSASHFSEVVALCKRGNWSGPFGSCVKSPNVCWTSPPRYSGGPGTAISGFPSHISRTGFSHGHVFEATCTDRGYVGRVRATCLYGQW
jgi:hypothetical protein